MKAQIGDVVIIRDRRHPFREYYGDLGIILGHDSRGYSLQTSEHGSLGILSHQGIEVIDHLSFDDLPTNLQLGLARNTLMAFTAQIRAKIKELEEKQWFEKYETGQPKSDLVKRTAKKLGIKVVDIKIPRVRKLALIGMPGRAHSYYIPPLMERPERPLTIVGKLFDEIN